MGEGDRCDVVHAGPAVQQDDVRWPRQLGHLVLAGGDGLFQPRGERPVAVTGVQPGEVAVDAVQLGEVVVRLPFQRRAARGRQPHLPVALERQRGAARHQLQPVGVADTALYEVVDDAVAGDAGGVLQQVGHARGLQVEVHHEHAAARSGQVPGEDGGGSGAPDPAFEAVQCHPPVPAAGGSGRGRGGAPGPVGADDGPLQDVHTAGPGSGGLPGVTSTRSSASKYSSGAKSLSPKRRGSSPVKGRVAAVNASRRRTTAGSSGTRGLRRSSMRRQARPSTSRVTTTSMPNSAAACWAWSRAACQAVSNRTGERLMRGSSSPECSPARGRR